MAEAHNYLSTFSNCTMQELPVKLRQLLLKGSDVQQGVLLDIVRCSENTEFGKKHSFSEINDIQDFRNNVPITDFSTYNDEVERLKKGEENILFPGKAHSFLATSGSTGIPKYIPESETGSKVKALVGEIRTVELIRMAPEIMADDAKILGITNSAAYEETEGGIPVGSASGQAAENSSMSHKFVLPLKLLTMKNISQPDMDYLTILFSLRDKNLTGVVCNNLAHFHILLERLYKDHDMLINDIRNETISVSIDEGDKLKLCESLKGFKDRADELSKLFAGNCRPKLSDIWPYLTVACCWLSASVGRVARDVKSDFPENTKFLDWGYGASEGKYNIPTDINSPAGVPAIFGYFFEFLPVGGSDTLLLEETEAGNVYELIVTSYSGFYRYNIHDAVRIGMSKEGFKTIEFVGKTSENIDTPMGKFYSYELTEMIEKYEQSNGVFIRFYELRISGDDIRLSVEAVCDGFSKADFERFISKELNDKKGIMLKGIDFKEDGYRDSMFTRALKPGKTVNQTKLAIFVTE